MSEVINSLYLSHGYHYAEDFGTYKDDTITEYRDISKWRHCGPTIGCRSASEISALVMKCVGAEISCVRSDLIPITAP